jgi:sulfate permease, SulP family
MKMSVRSVAGSTRRWVRGLRPEPGTLRQDLVAGVPGAISSVPNGMAASVLAGVNPVHGLYASLFGPIGGGLTSSTRLMVITTTSAAALAAGSALAKVPAGDRPRSLFLLTVLAGVLMILAGIFRLGRYTRFVPHSVMIGFLSGVAVNIVLGQLPELLGAKASGPYPLAKAWDMLLNLDRVNLGAMAAGLTALGLMAALGRTRLAPFSAVIALVIPGIIVNLWGSDTIRRVRDVGDIPRGLPTPVLPHLGDLSFTLVVGALSVTALVLVQGAGVSESAPNPDQSRSDANQDFVAQGVGNTLAGIFQGQPVGGSVGQTAVNVSAGARGRWAAISSGVWMAVILLIFSGLVGAVVMSTLAAVLIFAAIGSLRAGAIRAIMRTGRISQIAVVATFVSTLFLPIAAAVGFGLVLSLIMQLNREAQDFRVVQLVPTTEGHFLERAAPVRLESRAVVLLDIYGSLLYAGARTLQVRLPDPSGSEKAAVVLRLRGRAMLGSTAYAVLADYARQLGFAHGRLYISGIDPALVGQLRRNRTVERAGDVRIFEATEIIGEASLDAYHDAQEWVAARD